MKSFIKIIAFILSAVFVASALAVAAFAADGDEEEYELIEAPEVEYFESPASQSFVIPSSFKASFATGSSWTDFPYWVDVSYMDALKLQTSSPYYYLEYRVRDSYYGWGDVISSTESARYAGRSGAPITNVEIKVRSNISNSYDKTDYVVMYRAKAGGIWLDWVSNGSADVMRTLKSEFELDGELDYDSTDSGWAAYGCITAFQILLFERKSHIAKAGTNIINVPYINQNAIGFPNGCESVSTVMALQYLGEIINTETFVSKYLPMGSAPSYGVGADPEKVYVGNPRLTNGQGWGCYAPVVVKAVENYAPKTKLYATNVSGRSLSQLCAEYVDSGVPVMLWATVGMTSSVSYSYWVTPEGKSITYNNSLHCLLLVGYDDEYYYFNDPLRKIGDINYFAYSKSSVEAAYQMLGKQAVVIRSSYVTGIELTSVPSKSIYFLGEDLDTTGLSVKANYSSKVSEVVSGYTVSGFDTDMTGTKTITVSFGGCNASFDIRYENYVYFKGDANADGSITMSDVLIMRKCIAGLVEDSELAFLNADTNSDEYVNMSDVIYVRKHIAGLFD